MVIADVIITDTGQLLAVARDMLGLAMGAVALCIACWTSGRAHGYRQGIMDAVKIKGTVRDA